MLKDKKHGEVIAKLDFDPYERSLSYLTTRLLLPRNLNEGSVREALRQSRAYVAHDLKTNRFKLMFSVTTSYGLRNR
jgi:hypothetical protein